MYYVLKEVLIQSVIYLTILIKAFLTLQLVFSYLKKIYFYCIYLKLFTITIYTLSYINIVYLMKIFIIRNWIFKWNFSMINIYFINRSYKNKNKRNETLPQIEKSNLLINFQMLKNSKLWKSSIMYYCLLNNNDACVTKLNNK